MLLYIYYKIANRKKREKTRIKILLLNLMSNGVIYMRSNTKKWLSGIIGSVITSVLAAVIIFIVIPNENNYINHAPLITGDYYYVNEGELLNIPAPGVLSNDIDPDDDPLTAVLYNQPSYGSLEFKSDGSFKYKPNDDYYGTDTFTYKARDGIIESEITQVNIIVNQTLYNDIYPPRFSGSGEDWYDIDVSYYYNGDYGTNVFLTVHPLQSNGVEIPGVTSARKLLVMGSSSVRIKMFMSIGNNTYYSTKIRIIMEDSIGSAFYYEDFDFFYEWKGY
jgi:hypothetical protein